MTKLHDKTVVYLDNRKHGTLWVSQEQRTTLAKP